MFCCAAKSLPETLPGGQITSMAGQPVSRHHCARSATSGGHHSVRADRNLPSGIRQVGCFKIRAEKYIACHFRKIDI